MQPVSRVEKLTGRHALTALLAAAVLAFLLPFGTVSCGTPVTFTGLELATAGVPASSDKGHEFASEVESSGSAVALLGLLAAVAGLILAAAAVPGAGVAAIVGLLAVLLLPWIASYQWASYEVHEGWALAVASLAGTCGLSMARARSRRRVVGRRSWQTWVGGLALALPLVLTVVLCMTEGGGA
ncbi:MAG TPA: hypothetical protein VHH57_07590 [Gaiella sp.]|nr:hypothetical protein [Gaiella sp.]